MSAKDLVRVTIEAASEGAPHEWSTGGHFSVPASFLDATGLRQHLEDDGRLTIPAGFLPVSARYGEQLRLHCAFTETPPISARLPFSYQRVPVPLRTIVARVVSRVRRRSLATNEGFPAWPLDLSADLLLDLACEEGRQEEIGRTPVILTHDLDTREGLQNWVQIFLDLEEAVGARSTGFVVPCAWPLDLHLLDQARSRGHEIGVHGYDHSNQTAFLDSRRRIERLEAARELIEKFEVRGYRSPSLLRTRGLMSDLSRYYSYESSITTAGGILPVPSRGCASARPFRVEGITELPLSLPPEAGLCFIGFRPHEIFELWVSCAEQIAASGGVVVLLTHCEERFSGNSETREAYRLFLDYVASSSSFEWSTPARVLEREIV